MRTFKIPELDAVFEECLKLFPELQGEGIECYVSSEGYKRLRGKPIVILFLPKRYWRRWEAYRPLILHELSHFIAGNDPDRTEKVFLERADEKSKKLWKMLKEAGLAECMTEY